MGNIQSYNKVSFEDIKLLNDNNRNYLLINTLDENNQECLIKKTLTIKEETNIFNELIKNDKSKIIIIYGENCNSDKIYLKYNQLHSLGFYNIYLYIGGLFEWLLLQDIYGSDNFPTINNNKYIDILKYKPNTNLSNLLEFKY